MFWFKNMEPHKCSNPKCCNPSHWPKFNDKCPEDMTCEEIYEYVKKDDYKSLKTMILYSRGYLPISEIYYELTYKNNIQFIKYLMNALIEIFSDTISELLKYAIITPTEKKNENYFIFFFCRCNCTFAGLTIFDANLFLHKLGLSSFISSSNLKSLLNFCGLSLFFRK